MSNEQWNKGYKEVKNLLHNDIGITKEEVLDVFRQVAKDEIKELVSEKNAFIDTTIREIIRDEMVHAVNAHRYPKIDGRHMHFYGRNGRGEDSFENFISGTMKEEIIKKMEDNFVVTVEIDKK